MKGLLMRVGIDKTYGEYNAPINPITNDYLYMPIPQSKASFKDGMATTYEEIRPAFESWSDKNKAEIPFPERLVSHYVHTHLDPDFSTLTYGDQGSGRGNRVIDLNRGDFIVFFASFNPISKCEHNLIYALYGIMYVDKVIKVSELEIEKHHLNAHSRKANATETDLVVFADPKKSGRFDKAIPIGEYRNGAYRVSQSVLDEWGDIGVKDGFIQRSVCPPWFSDADKFIDWLKNKNVTLIHNNWES